MRFGNRHHEWTGALTREERVIYKDSMEGRERCRKWLKTYEGNLFRLERMARDRIASERKNAVKEAAE